MWGIITEGPSSVIHNFCHFILILETAKPNAFTILCYWILETFASHAYSTYLYKTHMNLLTHLTKVSCEVFSRLSVNRRLSSFNINIRGDVCIMLLMWTMKPSVCRQNGFRSMIFTLADRCCWWWIDDAWQKLKVLIVSLSVSKQEAPNLTNEPKRWIFVCGALFFINL